MPHVPISGRSSQEIRAQAGAYLRMAESARTTHAKQALQRLAARFVALAERREADERLAEAGQRGVARAEPGSE
jgi:hypothetical protein